uniref:Protein kinase domain-containing protein n=1 Tax=Seriola lalandi dorsalis TaxID=1841481 RepID=A0A3B4XLW0_SERLL
HICDPDVFPIPSDYELVDFVGSGDYGTVVKCRKRDTGETVEVACPVLSPGICTFN